MLIGCGAEEEQVNEGTYRCCAENTRTEKVLMHPIRWTCREMMDELEYAEFELEVEYAGDTEYEVKIEQKNVGTVKARIEESLNHVVKKWKLSAINELHACSSNS